MCGLLEARLGECCARLARTHRAIRCTNQTNLGINAISHRQTLRCFKSTALRALIAAHAIRSNAASDDRASCKVDVPGTGKLPILLAAAADRGKPDMP
jgi:hypothetical protein